VAEDDTLDAVGDGNVVSHLSSDSEESQGRSSSLVAERDGQRRRCNINDSRVGWLEEGREVFLGCDSEDEQTVLTVLIIYRCGDVCFQFWCWMNWTQGKKGRRRIVRIGDSRAGDDLP